MGSRERPVDRGRRHAARVLAEIGLEIREARVGAGLSQAAVARAAGTSQTLISRLERAHNSRATVTTLSQVLAVLGQRLSLKGYPEGSAIRDAGQAALIEKLRKETHPAMPWRLEVPVTRDPRDLRAWDAELGGPPPLARVEAETRLHDLQALRRRVELKQRDSTPAPTILLVAGTERNRRVLAEYRDTLSAGFPLGTAAILASLRAGGAPEESGIVLL
jgi:transcriptional regulator with XRE-family HTH domain